MNDETMLRVLRRLQVYDCDVLRAISVCRAEHLYVRRHLATVAVHVIQHNVLRPREQIRRIWNHGHVK